MNEPISTVIFKPNIGFYICIRLIQLSPVFWSLTLNAWIPYSSQRGCRTLYLSSSSLSGHPSMHCCTRSPVLKYIMTVREAAKKHFFSGPATKAFLPLELSGRIFWLIFLELQKRLFFLVAGPLKNNFFAASVLVSYSF